MCADMGIEWSFRPHHLVVPARRMKSRLVGVEWWGSRFHQLVALIDT